MDKTKGLVGIIEDFWKKLNDYESKQFNEKIMLYH
jgi:hypothetical protein